VSNNSDYSKIRSRIDKIIPDAYQSDIGESFMENTINRFLTKKETEYVDGFVGAPNTHTTTSRQLNEPDIISQANQLQPIITTILGTEKRYMSWADVISELRLQGVDISQLPIWGATDKYNWVPPIDIDKLIYFRDYFWVSDDIKSTPEYITIKNCQTTALSRVRRIEKMIERYGNNFPIVELLEKSGSTFSIVRIDPDNSLVRVTGNVLDVLSIGECISIQNTATNNNEYEIAALTYNTEDNWTIIEVTGNTLVSEEFVGQVRYTEYNGIVLSGLLDNLFESNFMFDVNDSINSKLSGDTFITVNSEYNSEDNTTTIFFDGAITSGVVSGNVTLSNQLTIAENNATEDCFLLTPESEHQWSKSNKWVHRNDVRNFASAKQANYPVIEFDSGIELNEYLETKHIWKYRKFNGDSFEEISTTPNFLELKPATVDFFTAGNTVAVLDKVVGNLSSLFVPGFEFLDQNNQQYVVASSTFEYDVNTLQYNTRITITTIFDSGTTSFIPKVTSLGDVWIGYNQHWIYAGVESELPTASPPMNPLGVINESITFITNNADYDYRVGDTVQEVIVKNITNKVFEFESSDLKNQVLLSSGDFRVYVNNIRRYGDFNEIEDPNTNQFVVGVEFNDSVSFSVGDIIRFEVGSILLSDHGLTNVDVRVEPDDFIFNTTQVTELVSITRIQKLEQLKSSKNQYPNYNLYNIDGTSANAAAPLMEYTIDQSAPVISELARRIKVDRLEENYSFTQNLINDTSLLGYKEMPTTTFWIDVGKQTIYKNIDCVWNKEFIQGNVFNTASFGAEPSIKFEGLIWFDSSNEVLYVYESGSFVESTSYVITNNENPSLKSIWRKAKEKYVPIMRDWNGRSESEYNQEKAAFIASLIENLQFSDNTLSDSDANEQANTVWFARQSNELSPTGEWVGDWTLPDYFYYNIENENRVELSSKQLIGHFEDIINSQDKVPGFLGTRRAQFHTLEKHEVDFGKGGNIRQYNNNFSTFISSVFVDNIIIPSLIEFAQNQYQVTLDRATRIGERSISDILNGDPIIFRDLYPQLLTKNRSNLSANSNRELVYGDSTTFDAETNTGIRNWIATLPNLGFLSAVKPSINVDSNLGLYELRHHDGHRADYTLTPSRFTALFNAIIENNTNVSNSVIVNDVDLPETYNELLAITPSKTFSGGFLWIDATKKQIFNLNLDFIQNNIDPPTIDGYLWLDDSTPNGTLKVSDGVSWTTTSIDDDGKLFNGNTIETSSTSAWRQLDLNEIILELLFDIENSLYEKSIDPIYNFDISSDLQSSFSTYVKDIEEDLPFTNIEYNITDPFSWNYRQSAPLSRFEMKSIDLANNSFIVQQLVASALPDGSTFFIKNSGVNDGTWTVEHAVEDPQTQTTEVFVIEKIKEFSLGLMYKGKLPATTNDGSETAAYWKSLYTQYYGTPYPHLEPWILQGYNSEPDWWNTQYKNTDNSIVARRWLPEMWNNIRAGFIPLGYELPDGQLSNGLNGQVTQYNYFSVNISSDVISSDGGVTNYPPDSLLPPFYNHTISLPTQPATVRSIFSNFVLEITNPSADYEFGHNSELEYTWKNTSQFLYDRFSRNFIEDPINFIVKTFGYNYNTIDGLLIDVDTQNVPSNKNLLLHGTITNDNSIVKVKGLNQWYVNYNRYTGSDTNNSSFLSLWKFWTAPLAYQFNSFIDTRTLDVSNNNVDVDNNVDYSVFVKKTNGIEEHSISGLIATILNIPPKMVNFDNSHLWKIQVSNNSSRVNKLTAYDVMNYPFYADVDTNICTLYTYKIVNVEEVQQVIEIDGDISDLVPVNSEIIINKVDTFTVSGVTFSELESKTKIVLLEPISSISSNDLITFNTKTIPWETGDAIWLSTEARLPSPLFGDVPNFGPIQYFIIRLSDSEFQIAETEAAALAHLPIELLSSGQSIHYVGQLENTFIAKEGKYTSNFWRHYKLDERYTTTITMPGIINGMQNFINFVDGYVAVKTGEGFDFTDETHAWQDQIESFIDYSFFARNKVRNRTIGNRYSVIPNQITNSWSFDGIATTFDTATAVNLVSVTGTLPTPLLPKVPYYIVNNSDGTFSLASTQNRAAIGQTIKLLDNGSVSGIEIYPAVDNLAKYPRMEVNSFRNQISFKPSRGVVSDMVNGPFDDINVANNILNQYGDPLTISDYTINRLDQKTTVSLTDVRRIDENQSMDEVDLLGSEGYLYISSATFFIDTYEHVIEFSDYTNDGVLLYDGFIGLNLSRFNINYNRQAGSSQRPNIGGSVIIRDDNSNLSTIDNIERLTDDLRYAYGDVSNNESNRYGPFARRTLGYDIATSEDYLNNININENSQFLFWQGLIQTKGSTGSINSFINSRRFVDAKIDEFWAYQVAEFGSTEEQEDLQLFINKNDVVNDSVKLEFVAPPEVNITVPGYSNSGFDIGGYDIITTSSDIQQITSDGFISVSINDNTRWYNQPDQRKLLEDNGLIFYFDNTATDSLIVPTAEFVSDETPTIEHNFNSDGVTITIDLGYTGRDVYTSSDFNVGDSELILSKPYIPYTDQIIVFRNGIRLVRGVDYGEPNVIDHTVVFGNIINFATPLNSNDEIVITYKVATLLEGRQYTDINSKIVRFSSNVLFSADASITIWNNQPNFVAHNASKIIDVDNNQVVANVNMFDPARNMPNQALLVDIDIINHINPATFNVEPSDEVLDRESSADTVIKTPWGAAEVGTVWADTSELEFIPYYDDKVFPDLNDRLQLWGKQAEFSNFKVYEWIESDVPPEDYDVLVSSEQGNSDIPEYLQKSGNAKLTTFKIIRNSTGNSLREIKNIIHTVNVLDVEPTSLGEYTFILPQDFIDSAPYNFQNLTVYVNGIRKFSLGLSSDPIILTDLKISDTVQFVLLNQPTNQQLQDAIEDGNVTQFYEHTRKTFFDNIGQEITKYYFWVENKVTRNQTSSNSPSAIEQGWSTTDEPFMVLQKPEQSTTTFTTEQEVYMVDFDYTISSKVASTPLRALQAHTEAFYMGGLGGSFSSGNSYEVGDILEMDSGVLVQIDATDIVDGSVSQFKIIFTGDDNIQPDIELRQVLINGAVAGTSDGVGFSIKPTIDNFGGSSLKLSTVINDTSSLIIKINNKEIFEKNVDDLTNGFKIVDNTQIDILKSVSVDDIISVQYQASRPLRTSTLPNRYTQAIVRNIRNFVDADLKYTIRFKKDLIFDNEVTQLNNKNLHKEWALFRQHQQTNIPNVLWVKAIESMIGHSIDDDTIEVPSVSRRLYDAQFGTNTRFGLDEGQTFANGSTLITTLLADLNNPENDFKGIDVASFLTLNTFDSSDDIINSMNNIYNSFATEDVNRIFFLFLNDALSVKDEYAKLLKTSMISIYGVRLLDTQEEF